MKEPLISVEKLTKKYGSECVLNDVSFDIYAGEILMIIGASGAGKSTLLNILSGLDKDFQGCVKLSKEISENRQVPRPIVFQDFDQLLPWYTVEKNILLPYNQKRLEPSDYELIDFVGLSEHLHKRPSALSGGMKQRAAIARSLISDSKIIFMDEPFGSLDPERRRKLQTLIKEINENFGRTIVFVTHDMEEADLLGHRSIKVNDNGSIEVL